MWCAAPDTIPSGITYPDDWYQGAVTFTDSLWELNLEAQEGVLVSDFTQTSGRTIDATNLASDGAIVLFINRLDGTLWSFDSTL